MGTVLAVCLSRGKGEVKTAAESAELMAGHGLAGDAHAGGGRRQVSLLGRESVVKMALPDLAPGAFAENILTEGLVLSELPVGTRLRVGRALLEVTQIGKECHSACAIREKTGDCVMPREGVFAVVLEGGVIRAGDLVEACPVEDKS
ncbi:MAG: MOSC domain-containing protein [Deltaproteobacteria bacterium]|nr:MOSC domain-containing protein [Deltaproteobacteria bacterium]